MPASTLQPRAGGRARSSATRNTGASCTPIDFVGFARACGGTGFCIDDAARCGAVLDEALATPGAVLVEAVVARGEPNRWRIALTVLGDKVRELI